VSGIPWKHIVAVPVLLILYFYGLTRVGLLTPDEPRYAAIGREMAASGDFITPRLWGEPWFEKPALLYWMIAAGHLAGLTDEAAARTPVALMGTGFLFLFFHRLRREFGEKAALYASVVLASCAGWLVYSHVAVTDIPLAATFAGAILMFLPWIRSGGRRGLVIGGVLLGFAVLAKGLVPLVLALPVFWIARRWWVDLLLMTGACATVAAPWYVLCWLRNGQVFIDEFFYKHHFGRFLSEELQHVQPWWYYAPVLLGLLFPWTPGVVLLFRRDEYRDKRKLLIAAVAAFGLVFFSASTNKLAGYILPVVPLLAALIGIRLSEVQRVPVIFAIAGLSLAAVPVIAVALPSAVLQGASRSPIGWAVDVPMAIGVFAILAFCCWRLESRGRRPVAAGLIFGATVVCVGGLKLFTFPAMDSTASARPLWRRMQSGNQAACAPEDAPRSIRYGLNYYAGHVLPSCEAPDPYRR
jgi:4-amino-4-deoxy-L-arabinose transferase-like glycosyltransferase